MNLNIVDSMDDMLKVWHISRPYVIEDKPTEESDLLRMNLPITQFKVYTIYFKTSILFRDLIFTFRPVSEWARSNRTIKFTAENLKLSDDVTTIIDNLFDIEELQSKLNSVIDRVNKGEKQDFVKKDLPLMTETEFCINVNYRTLMNIVRTFEVHFPKYFKIFYAKLCLAIPEFMKDYMYSMKNDLFYDVALTDEEIEMNEGHQSVGSINVVKVNVKANLMAQFIRQHSSTIKNGLWNLINQTYYAVCMSDCSLDVDCVAIISDSRWRNLVSTRTCWFAQFDKEDNSSWSYVLRDYVNEMTSKEFMNQLPCKGKCNNCKIYKDMQPRILHTEVNPPCPILIENPYIIDQRISQYGSDSSIMNKWKESKPYIRFNPDNSDNKLYSSISKEAGTNIK